MSHLPLVDDIDAGTLEGEHTGIAGGDRRIPGGTCPMVL